jgi:anhydro-N-acetylmuramic acid kinase
MKTIYKAIGAMSGTSLDGLDIAYCEFEKKDNTWSYKIIHGETLPYEEALKNQLVNIFHHSAIDLAKLHAEYGQYMGRAIEKFILHHQLKPDLIASHGHTIFHKPSEGFTFQLGSGANIHGVTGLPVVSDFRTVDVSLGGQGAPLVPIGDKLLFTSYDLCLNLGGIANISCDVEAKRIAYDICPVNQILNTLSEKIGKPYDDKGMIAASGKINNNLLQLLNKDSYYTLPFPKSMGREYIEEKFLPIFQSSTLSIPDQLATATEHIADIIAKDILSLVKSKATSRLLITGGGAFNMHLIEVMRKKLGDHCNVELPDDNTICFKEALIFAFLGVLRLRGEVNSIASVTGASRDNIGGAIYGGN